MSSRKKKDGGKKKATKQEPAWTVDDLLMKAEDCLSDLQPELAEKFYQKAYEMEPNNTQVLDSYAYLLLDLQEFDKGKELLERSIALEPLSNPVKYLNLGQILQGQEAIKFFNLGIENLSQQLQQFSQQIEQQNRQPTEEEAEELDGIKEQITGAYCSIAEIYLTDECFAENAESECERCLGEAIKWYPQNPEPYQTLASVRMSQHKNQEALELIQKAYSLWKDLELEELPSYEFRHTTGKLFLELEQNAIAAEIWESLLEEDDNIAETHYFLGLAYRSISSSAARECVNRAKELLVLSQCDDEKLVHDVEELCNQIANENVETQDNGKEEDDGIEEDDNEMDVDK